MKPADFLNETQVRSATQDLLGSCAGREFSDIVDDAGNQYVDLVMEGGGVLGVALVGYTYALEQAGIRFLRIGGTSAGAINALLLAALDVPAAQKSERILEAIADLDFLKFVDGGFWARGLVRAIARQAGPVALVTRALLLAGPLLHRLGINPGDHFQTWLAGVLRRYGIRTTMGLRQRMRTLPPGLRLRTGEPLTVEEADPYLALVTSDVSTETKVDLPRMAGLYWERPDEVNPAAYVRASMSIPYFFEPYFARDIPAGNDAAANWLALASWNGDIPKSCLFVDGGIMSNFPISLFHDYYHEPTAPTFGVKLGSSHRTQHPIANLGGFSGALFDSARHCLDYDFLIRHPEYRRLVAYVDTSGHHWLNFSMTGDEKIELFTAGIRAARSFLAGFEWQDYKNLRRELLKMYSASEQHPLTKAEGLHP